ncbi:oxidoreductase [Mycobacterium sp.]|uniref:oxidoreductase n=1 Tax=Mycobacterium sp. TaxID=1785 RepID=UPI002C988424|nr:oxidoreductase [Mycobacterium sp.]HTH92151.1 oxidoreductase [Mycobacterium sp.]
MSAGVAIVTGASSGIGAAVARRLNAQGHRVYAVARRVDLMAPLAEDGIIPVRVDVTDDTTLEALVSRVISECGRIDVLVNNAGYGALGAIEDVPLAEARRQFDVNMFGLARLTQLVLPHMRAQGSGRIINMSSMGGRIHTLLGGWYHATKFALEGFSDALRLEVGPFGIQVVVIEPGAIDTEWHGVAAENLLATSGEGAYADQAAAVAKILAAARLGSSPEVIAEAVDRAVRARRPRSRYAVGLGAKPAMLARRVLPDKVFDRMLRLTFRLGGRIVGTPTVCKITAGRAS